MYTAPTVKKEDSYNKFGKLIAIVVFMVALFLIVLFVLPERSASAGSSAGKTYTITSVKIKEGDSLWSLASEYYTDEFSSVTAYIEEIKRMNGLSSDVLYADNYILLPHFIAK